MPASKKSNTKKILEMTLDGMGTKEIATKLNVSYSTVTSARKRGRDKGELPKIEYGSPLSHGSTYYLRRGCIGDIISGLSKDQLIWLVKEADNYECETLAEVILEMVRDAHAEAKV